MWLMVGFPTASDGRVVMANKGAQGYTHYRRPILLLALCAVAAEVLAQEQLHT
jgi:hypothetical protein